MLDPSSTEMESPHALVSFRSLYCAALVLCTLLAPPWIPTGDAAANMALYNPVPSFEAFRIPRITQPLLVMVPHLLALLYGAAGRRARRVRVALLVASVSYVWLWGTAMGYRKESPDHPFVKRTHGMPWLVLFVLSITPSVAAVAPPLLLPAWVTEGLAYSCSHSQPIVRRPVGWGMLLIKWYLASAYFGTGVCKIMPEGKLPLTWAWAADATTLPYVLKSKLLMAPNAAYASLNFLLRDVAILRQIASWITLSLEVFYPLTVVLELAFPRALCVSFFNVGFSLFALSMHLGILLTTGINFKFVFVTHLVNLSDAVLVCRAVIRRCGPRASNEETTFPQEVMLVDRDHRTTRAPASVAGWVSLSIRSLAWLALLVSSLLPLYLIAFDLDWWPLSTYRVFCESRHHRQVTAWRLAFAVNYSDEAQAHRAELQCCGGPASAMLSTRYRNRSRWNQFPHRICLHTANEQALYRPQLAAMRKGQAFKPSGRGMVSEMQSCSRPSPPFTVPVVAGPTAHRAAGLMLFYGVCEDPWWSSFELNSKVKDALGTLNQRRQLRDSEHVFKRHSACSIFVNSGATCARRFFHAWPESSVLVVLVQRSSPNFPKDLMKDWPRDNISVARTWPLTELRREAAASPCIGSVVPAK